MPTRIAPPSLLVFLGLWCCVTVTEAGFIANELKELFPAGGPPRELPNLFAAAAEFFTRPVRFVAQGRVAARLRLGTEWPHRGEAKPSGVLAGAIQLHAMKHPDLAKEMRELLPSTQPDKDDIEFLGVPERRIREVAERVHAENTFTVTDAFAAMTLPHIEARFLGILLLQYRFAEASEVLKRHGAKQVGDAEAAAAKILRMCIFRDYVSRIPALVNTASLVDVGASGILGPAILADYPASSRYFRRRVAKMAKSKKEWRRRSAAVALETLLDRNDIKAFEKMSLLLIEDEAPVVRQALAAALQKAGRIDHDYLLHYLESYSYVMRQPLFNDAIRDFPPEMRATLNAMHESNWAGEGVSTSGRFL